MGTVFEGRYRIDARIGQGGMGEVWRATQLAVGRSVAIKILRKDWAIAPGIRARLRGLRGDADKSALAAALDDLGCYEARAMAARVGHIPSEYGFAGRSELESAAQALGLDVEGLVGRGKARCRQAR